MHWYQNEELLRLLHCYYFPQALLVAVSWGFVFSVVSAFSPNYYLLLLFRGLVGFGFGGSFIL